MRCLFSGSSVREKGARSPSSPCLFRSLSPVTLHTHTHAHIHTRMPSFFSNRESRSITRVICAYFCTYTHTCTYSKTYMQYTCSTHTRSTHTHMFHTQLCACAAHIALLFLLFSTYPAPTLLFCPSASHSSSSSSLCYSNSILAISFFYKTRFVCCVVLCVCYENKYVSGSHRIIVCLCHTKFNED